MAQYIAVEIAARRAAKSMETFREAMKIKPGGESKHAVQTTQPKKEAKKKSRKPKE